MSPAATTVDVASIMTPGPTAVPADADLDLAMRVMEEEGVRHLPVLRDGRLAGILSERDLLEVTGWLHPDERRVLEAPEGRVGTYMTASVVTVGPHDSVSKAALRLTSRHVGCLPVVEDGVLVGVVAETDFARAFVVGRRSGRIPPEADVPVRSCMTPDVVSVDELTDAEVAMDRMHALHIRHLPVVRGEQLVGIVSERDFLLAIGRGAIDGASVRELMTRGTLTIGPDEPVSAAAEILAEGLISALPVADGEGGLVGMLTLPDLLAPLLEALRD